MCFHFQNVLSFSECAFIFGMCFHFQILGMKRLVSVSFFMGGCLIKAKTSLLAVKYWGFIQVMLNPFRNVLSFSKCAFIYKMSPTIEINKNFLSTCLIKTTHLFRLLKLWQNTKGQIFIWAEPKLGPSYFVRALENYDKL